MKSNYNDYWNEVEYRDKIIYDVKQIKNVYELKVIMDFVNVVKMNLKYHEMEVNNKNE